MGVGIFKHKFRRLKADQPVLKEQKPRKSPDLITMAQSRSRLGDAMVAVFDLRVSRNMLSDDISLSDTVISSITPLEETRVDRQKAIRALMLDAYNAESPASPDISEDMIFALAYVCMVKSMTDNVRDAAYEAGIRKEAAQEDIKKISLLNEAVAAYFDLQFGKNIKLPDSEFANNINRYKCIQTDKTGIERPLLERLSKFIEGYCSTMSGCRDLKYYGVNAGKNDHDYISMNVEEYFEEIKAACNGSLNNYPPQEPTRYII